VETQISFYLEDTSYYLRSKKNIRKWITQVILSEGKKTGVINFVICSDKYLLELNQEYLNHNTYTDTITFDYSEDDKAIIGDVFISIDRIKENAKSYSQKLSTELHRVMCHGVLHLLGFADKTEKQSLQMRDKEDYYLSLLPKYF